jgi:acyl-CoA thioester hydrolase
MHDTTGGEAPFSWPIRVYWEDTDAGGVVYHAGYLRFLERARSEWLRARGVDQQQLRDDTGIGFVVRDMQIGFVSPARLDDELQATVEVERLRPASMAFAQSIQRQDGTLLVRATVRAACVDLSNMRPRPIPDDLMARISPNR